MNVEARTLRTVLREVAHDWKQSRKGLEQYRKIAVSPALTNWYKGRVDALQGLFSSLIQDYREARA